MSARRRHASGPFTPAGCFLDALLVGIATGAPCAVLAYAVIRIIERFAFPEPNPALLVWSDQSPLVVRMAISLYLGGLATFGGFALARRRARVIGSWLVPLMGIATIAILTQTVLVP